MIVWVAGRNRGGKYPDIVWDILGVFKSKELARKTCVLCQDFFAPLEVDERLPSETMAWPDLEYPNASNNDEAST